jgi:hypothetical protein
LQYLGETPSSPLFPVVAVVRVQRAALALNLDVPRDGNFVMPCEPGPAIDEVPLGIEVF